MGSYDFFGSLATKKEEINNGFFDTNMVEIGYYFQPLTVGGRTNMDFYKIEEEEGLVKRIRRNMSYVEDVHVISEQNDETEYFERNEISLLRASNGALYAGIKYMPDLTSYNVEICFAEEIPKLGRTIGVETLSVSGGHGYMVTGVKYEERKIEVDKVLEFNKALYAIMTVSKEMFLVKLR